ncbi:replication restart helicase PriA [Ignatzschineria cameli]|uniref:Replication restart protein PriA n=1 Tax=Ignatzschineria cameli TaxID=2182793 RepID=A0ABX5KX23_9GAMM|nr:primosomal protein N' [Ignatzschineria cameli]PWD87669.1 primosomal protein N' [Ignatzschineria cameli]PWD88603.1 primosomal protein N' [Ignatzschineria cameli]PWD88927.1 primosomal protein N' [Ignatzschineria cameli]
MADKGMEEIAVGDSLNSKQGGEIEALSAVKNAIKRSEAPVEVVEAVEEIDHDLAELVVEVALPCPLYRTFEYLAPARWSEEDGTDSAAGKERAGKCKSINQRDLDLATSIVPQQGMRVAVNFARREMIGIILAIKRESDYPREKLKPIEQLLDRSPIITSKLLSLAERIAHYYHAPIGEVLQLFLPTPLRQGRPLYLSERYYQITKEGIAWREEEANRASRAKIAILNFFEAGARYRESTLLTQFPNFKNHRRALLDATLIESEDHLDSEILPAQMPSKESPLQLTAAQQQIVDSIVRDAPPLSFIEGVTGSGKTAVYTEIARHHLARGEQVLMLVPEIGLTPQFVTRIESALAVRVAVIHSQLSDNERLEAWRNAALGRIDLLIGTRSALFTPFARLGLMIIDEAHDSSYIQRDGVRYSAHNSAIWRAHFEDIPLVMGSATPTYESVRNIAEGRFSYYQLPERVSGAMPEWEIIDLNEEKNYDGISTRVLDEIEATIARKEQVLIFLNRRGFSPVLTCLDCGTIEECHHCSSYLNFHRTTGMLHCHHCGTRYPYPTKCRSCGGTHFKELGAGTQKIEKALADAFPLANVLRFDRDNVRNSRELVENLTQIGEQSADIIVGTQMLAKGHDFPNITLVVLLNSDGLFFANDFRADEKLAQLLMQVSGRAGRGEKKGKVLVQTMFPDNALFHQLPKIGYQAYAQEALEVRQILNLPPYSYQILVQVEARSESEATNYLEGLLNHIEPDPEVEVTPVMPNNLKRRQGFYRVHVVLQSERRSSLHRMAHRIRLLYEANTRSNLRLLIEVDPIDFT